MVRSINSSLHYTKTAFSVLGSPGRKASGLNSTHTTESPERKVTVRFLHTTAYKSVQVCKHGHDALNEWIPNKNKSENFVIASACYCKNCHNVCTRSII